MSIEEIPADQVVVMTDQLHRSFQANGCNPCCHSCGAWIKPNELFQLVTRKSRTHYPRKEDGRVSTHRNYVENGELASVEIMICNNCDPDDFEKRQYEDSKLFKERQKKYSGGCYRINGKIVH